jgi:hypothetical protein
MRSYMMDPLGFQIASGEVVTGALVTGKSWKKWAVPPVSAMTPMAGPAFEVV